MGKELSMRKKSSIIKVPLPNERMILMLDSNLTTNLLNMEGVIVTKAENIGDSLHISIEMPRQEQICPQCGERSNRVHDYRNQQVKDIPFGRTTYLNLRKRRYVCPGCGKRFYENWPILPRYHRMTSRAITGIIEAFRSLQPASQIAKQYNVSPTTAIRYFDQVSYGRGELPEVLSIDEFKGNADGEKYQTILTAPLERKVYDILPNRKENDLIRYFKGFQNRDRVKYFVTDMNPHFKAVAKACFPKAVIVADRYHVIRQAVWAMEAVRKKEQANLPRKFRLYFKRSKWLLNKPFSKLTEEEMDRLALMFEISPRLADAYDLKNRFLHIMRLSSIEEAKPLLSAWLLDAESAHLPEFQNCVTAYRNWYNEILNSLIVPWSNGFTEGCNNKTKVLKRVCFGFRNFRRFRSRILHSFS